MENDVKLGQLKKTIEITLTEAVETRKHAFRLMVIGTIGAGAANLRTVVLRGFQTDHFMLTFYTDIRSKKIKELQKNPHLTCLFWNPEEQIQLKIIGEIQIEQNTAHTKSVWKKMHIGAKKAYLTLSAPGTIQGNPSNNLPENLLKMEEGLLNDQHFCIVHCEIKEMEWLQLARSGHVRARFQKDQAQKWKGHWLVP